MHRVGLRKSSQSIREWPLWTQYAFSLGAVVAALAVRLPLDPVLHHRVPFITLFMVLLPLVLLVRPGPFLAASILGLAGAAFAFRSRFVLLDAAAVFELLLYALVATTATATAILSDRAEKRRRSGDAMLRGFVDESPTCKWVTDHQGRIIYANPAMAEALGRPVDQVIGRTHDQLLPPKLAQLAVQHIRSVRESGQPCVSFEEIEPLDDKGSRRVLEWRRFMLKMDGHDHVLVAGMANDISEKSRIERALRDNEERLRAVFETVIDGIITIDERGVIESVNPAAERLFGYTAAELVGRNINTLMPDPYRREHDSYLQNYQRTGVRKIIGIGREVVGLRKDGSQFPMDLAVSEMHMGPKHMFTGLVRDISERKHAEATLRESEERFRLMADAAPVLIWLSGTDKLCIWFNKQWLDFVGRPMEKELGNGWAENVHPDDFDRCLQTYVNAFDAREPFSMEYRLKRHDGQYRWLVDHGVPRHDSRGEFAGYIGSCIDITDRAVAEQALRESQERLQHHKDTLEETVRQRTAEVLRAEKGLATSQRLASVGTMAAGLAHDINNITMPLGARIDDLLNNPEVNDNVKGELAVITALIDHLRMMSKNLSLFARDPDQEGSVGATELASWCLSVQGLMEASLAGTEGRRGSSYVRLKCDIPVGLPPVPVATHRLTQAVMNLVHNARDAILIARAQGAAGASSGAGGGCVTIEARPHSEHPASATTAVILKVSDDGCGMDEETKRRCIEPFFTTKTRAIAASATGSGMGLSMAHRICESVGGSLDIQSELGKGTTITMTLPVVNQPVLSRDEHSSAAALVRTV